MLLGVFVDDIILAAKTQAQIADVVHNLVWEVEITSNELTRFVGYEVTRDRQVSHAADAVRLHCQDARNVRHQQLPWLLDSR